MCCLIMGSIISKAQTDTIARRIILIGDAGQLTDGKHPVVDAVRNYIPLDKKSTVLFLGDNLYKHGLPSTEASNYEDSRVILDSQIAIARGKDAKVYMIPGNHDWHNGNRDGYEAIVRQQFYVDFIKMDSVDAEFLPKEGCPGPEVVNIGDNILLLIYDSQWWLHPHEKPEIESDCDCKTEDELVSKIRDIATQNTDKFIIVASHHPFKSNGVHGGFFTFKQHLFPFTDIRKSLYLPLPVLGSVYVIARSVFGASQDLKHPTYANMIKRITGAIETSLAPNVVFVSGHEHNLQHIKDENFDYIVSGGGCKQSRISKRKNGLFNSPEFGFAVLEVSTNKNVNLSFYTVTDSVRKEYSSFLLNYTKPVVLPIDTTLTPIVLGNKELKFEDSVSKPASTTLPVIHGLKKYFTGQNYRPEWSTPVKMKVLNLKTEKGGLKITSLGGGQQTRSLRLEDASGKEWVLRGVNKNIGKALPESFRGTAAEDFSPELNSGAHPYGGLIVPALAKPLDILTASPELFFVPDDPALGLYRLLFANTVCMLEERNVSGDKEKSMSTSKALFEKILEDNDHLADQPKVLTARLLDILIGDFDRHFDQWRWGTTDPGKGKIYYPIPRDRDQAFFNSEGKIFKWVTSRTMPFLRGFKENFHQINWLGFTAKDFDRIFLTELTEENWKNSITDFQNKMTDSVIRNAVMKLPSETFVINGETIIKKLISRRNEMSKEALRYYKFLSKKVNVVGSNQKEYFKVSNYGEGLQVKVYEKSKGYDTSFVMYNRIFDPAVTKEIRLFGLNGEDVFDIEENAKSRIKIRIIGGKDNDTFNIRGQVKNIIYDKLSDLNFIQNKSHTKNRFSLDPPSSARSIMGYQYNTIKFPQVLFSYNSDDGYMIGAGFAKRTYGFKNLPYATDQQFSALYALNRKAFQLKYKGEFNHITRKLDLVVKGNFLDPALRNFTGFGNKTPVYDGNNFDFYRSRYRSLEVEALFRKRVFDRLHLMAGPYYYRYWNKYDDNSKNILSDPRKVGLDSADVFSNKSYLGGKFVMQFDNRNNTLFPTRGIFWNNEFTVTSGSGFGSSNLVKYTSDMTINVSFKAPAKIVFALGLGGGHIFSKNFEYFQALSLGVDNPNIHGFRKNRYSGSSLLYASAEIKLKLFDINSYILPGPFGITGFYDVGRVWMNNESSRLWHGAIGGGIYFIPFNNFIISATAGFSDKERLLNFNLGTKVNLTF